MPDPRFILSFRPPVDLEILIDSKEYSNIKVYIDFKNVAVSLYLEEVARDIVANSQHRYLDSTIFQSVLCSLSWWKRYALEHKVGCDIYFFTDGGKSSYHRSILSSYKERRTISNLRDPQLFEDLFKVREKNSLLAENIINRLPNSYFFNLKYLEADFIPYFLITRKLPEDENTLHIVVSNDKDMYQNLLSDNIVQIYTKNGERHLIDRKSIFYAYSKIGKSSKEAQKKLIENISKISPEYISLAMALVGDSSDDVPGIDGIGPKKALRMLSDEESVTSFVGSMDEVYDRVSSGKNIFLNCDEYPDKEWEKAVEDSGIVTTAIKLISFELLCRRLEHENSIEKIDMNKYINRILYKEIDLIDEKMLTEAVERLEDCYIEEDVIKNIFKEYIGEV